MGDVDQLFEQAEAAFVARRFVKARQLLQRVLHALGDEPAVLHLLALVEKQAGEPDASERAFAAALKRAPRDAQIRGNYANLLSDLGRNDDALAQYDLASAADPTFAEARFNRALVLQRLGRFPEALEALDDVLGWKPDNARAHSARGAVLRSLGRLGEAAAAYDRALAAAPAHAKALVGRARVAMERGDPDAAAQYRKALATEPENRDLLLGLADALEAAGDPEADAVLAHAVAHDPVWIEGLERLAEMRAEAGDRHDFARGHVEVLARHPQMRELHGSYCRTLARGGLFRQALNALEAVRPRLAPDRDMLRMEAAYRSEVGEHTAAEALFAHLGDDPPTTLERARSLLRRGLPDESAALLEGAVAARPEDISAWALLGLAWRVIDHAGHEWLCGQPGLFGAVALELDDGALSRIASSLRDLHRTRAHPIGQSLRGGTQTRGRLFWRKEAEIAELKRAIDGALTRFVSGLPPIDPSHPLLRHREASLQVEGSWSVRLVESGFHVSHIHTQGVLSSACHIALPESLGSGENHEGWLQLGTPPVELGLSLGALSSIEPREGWLALFPSYLYHGTLPFSSGERLTVAFDVVAR